jgi:hypothetical protein
LTVPEQKPDPEPDDQPGEPLPRKRKSRKRKREETRGPLPEAPQWILPTFLLVVGLGVAMSASAASARGKGMLSAVGINLLVILISIPVTLFAMGVAARLVGISFGELRLVLLKVAALTVVGNGAAWLSTLAGAPPPVALGLNLACVVLFLWILFEMEFQDRLFAIFIICFVQAVIARWLLAILNKLLVSGAG